MKTNWQTKKIGDILKGTKRSRDAALHFIVFLDGRDHSSFVGAMLTRSNRYGDNVLMSENHFSKNDNAGKPFEFQFDDTHFVNRKFIKLQDWGPFEKIGELTPEGIEFISSKVGSMEPILWDDYLKEHRMHEN